MLPRPAKRQKPTMNRIILIACAILLIVNFYSEVVLATRYESSLDKSKEDGKLTALWTSPRMGRRKRNLKDEAYKITEQELADLWEIFGGIPTAVITINGNDKFICKTMQVKRDPADSVPRVGRNLEDLLGIEKWVREARATDTGEKSPPIVPRFGRRLSPYSPRLGRDT